jgi:hypothetical protein
VTPVCQEGEDFLKKRHAHRPFDIAIPLALTIDDNLNDRFKKSKNRTALLPDSSAMYLNIWCAIFARWDIKKSDCLVW